MSAERALKQKTRKLIYNYICTHPGVSNATIREVFDLKQGTLSYHLNYLERCELIISKVSGKFRCCYPVDPPNSTSLLRKAFHFDPGTLTELQQRLLAVVKQRPGINITELETMLNVNRRVLQYNIKVLREKMLVWKIGNGRNTQYEFASQERIHNELSRFAIMQYMNGDIDEETYNRLKGEIEREKLKK